MNQKQPTPPESLLRAYQAGKSAGLKYVYTGNVADSEHQGTYCPKCHNLNIVRDWHSVVKNELVQGKCSSCGYYFEGVWQ